MKVHWSMTTKLSPIIYTNYEMICIFYVVLEK